MAGRVEICNNDGVVIAESQQAGGIIGSFEGGTVESCNNKGNIVSKYDLNDANNSGLVAGGICGTMGNGTVKNCGNYGEVIAECQNAGGIIGNMTNGTVEGCNNLNRVEVGVKNGPGIAGGIVAWQQNGVVQKCFNIGNVVNKNNNLTNSDILGGISGYIIKGTIKYSYSQTNFEGGKTKGGVIGYVNTSYTQTIGNCFYSGELTRGIGNKATDVAGKTDKIEELTDFDIFKQWITNKFPDLTF